MIYRAIIQRNLWHLTLDKPFFPDYGNKDTRQVEEFVLFYSEMHRGMRAMLFRIPLLLNAIAMRERGRGGREGESMARRRGWSPDCNCSGKPETHNYATYRMENCVPRSAFACIPGCTCRPAFAVIPAVSMLYRQLKVCKYFHIYEVK